VDGDVGAVPEDRLPAGFQVELFAEMSFGTKLARISRLVALQLPPDFKPSGNPPPPIPHGTD